MDDPETVHAVMVFVRERYLAEKGFKDAISPDEARVYFEANRDQYGFPEMRIGRILWVETKPGESGEAVRERVDSIRNRIASGESVESGFIQAVATESEHVTTRSAGLMEPTARRGKRLTTSEPVADALFALSGEGAISEPFAVDGGWAIVSLVRAVPGREANYDSVSAMVKSEIREKRIRKFVEGLNDAK